MGALAVVVSVLVGLPPYAAAPAPGALPAGAEVRTLDRSLGIVEVRLPRDGLSSALVRLRHAPGTRYATVEQDVQLQQAGCAIGPAPRTELSPTWWRTAVHVPARADASGFTVGIVDSGADVERLGSHQVPIDGRDFTKGSDDWNTDRLGHGTAVASLIAANRSDIGVRGIAPSADLVVARVAVPGACTGTVLEANMVSAMHWLRTQDVAVLNVSASVRSSPAIRDEVRALQLRGVLVVAAAGNRSESATAAGYPAALPHVLGVAALSGPGALDKDSVSGRLVDLAAPASFLSVVASSFLQAGTPKTITAGGTSFAAPLVSGAAALVWAAHPGFKADQVSAALRRGARKLGSPRPNTRAGWGVLDVSASLKQHPAADLDEPNDWVDAARSWDPLGPGTVHASLDAGDDPIDAYRVHLRQGQRITLRWTSGLAGLKVLIEAPNVPGTLLDGALALAEKSALTAVDGPSGELKLKARQTGDYLLVLAGETGRGAYSLSVARS
jgi:subtilisin family serine protease